jgi:Protein of unknown function (DUF2750)
VDHRGVSVGAAQAAAFFKEVAVTGAVWGIRDADGFPAPAGTDGRRAMPFWSTTARAERVIATVGAYAGFEPVRISVAKWMQRWLPGLERDRLLVGINWSGDRAHGYDLDTAEVLNRLRTHRAVHDP